LREIDGGDPFLQLVVAENRPSVFECNSEEESMQQVSGGRPRKLSGGKREDRLGELRKAEGREEIKIHYRRGRGKKKLGNH